MMRPPQMPSAADLAAQKPGDFWDGLYRQRADDDAAWGVSVNPVLAETTVALPPGDALDLGCGTGGDTIWLARQGWRVTAVDISATAVERVAVLAREQGFEGQVATERHDLAYSFPAGAYDLISAQYLHTPYELPRSTVLSTAARALRPGGRLLVVDHGSIAPWSWNQDPDTRFATPEEVFAGLALPATGWVAEQAEALHRQATGPQGQVATVTDHVLLVRRTGD